MRAVLLLLLGACFSASIALADEPQALSFSAEGDTYVVPQDGLTRVEAVDKRGLQFCPAPAVETAIAAFTSAHEGNTVVVAIGQTEVFRLQIVTPYDSGCITWPLHPKVAENYRAMLTGEAAPQ